MEAKNMMKICELKRIIDSVHELHGPDALVQFRYQRASGKIGVGDITRYSVSTGGVLHTVHFSVDYPRGETEA
jgi:hypothetical protein